MILTMIPKVAASTRYNTSLPIIRIMCMYNTLNSCSIIMPVADPIILIQHYNNTYKVAAKQAVSALVAGLRRGLRRCSVGLSSIIISSMFIIISIIDSISCMIIIVIIRVMVVMFMLSMIIILNYNI